MRGSGPDGRQPDECSLELVCPTPPLTDIPARVLAPRSNTSTASRIRWIRLRLTVAVVLVVVAAPAFAQPAFDQRRLIAPAAPGGGWDQTARVMQQVLLRTAIARTVPVENIPGAAGTIGLARFVSAERSHRDVVMRFRRYSGAEEEVAGVVGLGAGAEPAPAQAYGRPRVHRGRVEADAGACVRLSARH